MSEPEAEELKIYEVTHRETGQVSYQPALTAVDACKQAGWIIDDCFVNEQKPRRKPVPDHDTLILVKIPCKTCPYQYAECKKPAEADCPTRNQLPELADWLKQATQAHLCDYVGKELTKKDYLLGQKWLSIEDAIKELSPKP